jgi:hypothetical protein
MIELRTKGGTNMTPAAAVPFDDAHALTLGAWDFLEAEKDALGLPGLAVQPVDSFLKAAEQNRTTSAERELIMDQAALMFDHLYPHLPFKTDIYHFIHPQDFINQNLRPGFDSLGESDFHDFVVAAFSLVRDAHTLYVKPSPFRGAVAFLPFQMLPYEDETGRHYVVTKVMKAQTEGGFGHPFFGPGAEVLFWGEEPIDNHVQRAAGRLPGGNPAASFTRGAIHCSLRPLAFVQMPFDDELPAATIQYRPFGSSAVRAIRLPWGVATGFGKGGGFPGRAFSVSVLNADSMDCCQMIHGCEEFLAQIKMAPTKDPGQVSILPETFEFQHTKGAERPGFLDPAILAGDSHPDARFGYIRIKKFSDSGSALGMTDRMVAEFQRILTLMDTAAPDGLVLDIRGNPGGDVHAAERMLQMLTPVTISPQMFHLANTPAMLQILQNLKEAIAQRRRLSPADDAKLTEAKLELGPWLEDANNQPLPAGERLTTGRGLTDFGSANDIGQVYQGRVGLLVDGLTYSASDIFAAGFQDHQVGRIFGTDATTGGGGGNVWSHADLLQKLGPTPGVALAHLPRDAGMSLAIRRCSRVGFFQGQPVEDVGVTVDDRFPPACAEDVILGFPSLIQRACEYLGFLPTFRVDVLKTAVLRNGSVTVELATTNVNSLQFLLDGHLALTAAAGEQRFTVPAVAGISSPARLRIKGFRETAAEITADTLPAAVRTVSLRDPAPAPDPNTPDPVTQSPTGTN